MSARSGLLSALVIASLFVCPEAGGQDVPGLVRSAPRENSEAFLFQQEHYWHISMLDGEVLDDGTVGQLHVNYRGLSPGRPLLAALAGDFDQDGEGDLLLLQDDAYAVIQLRGSVQVAAGTPADLGLDPEAAIDGATVLGRRFVAAAQGTRIVVSRFDAGVPSVVGETAFATPVDALAAWRLSLFVFSGDSVTRWDLETNQMESFSLADLGVEGPVDTASVGPTMPGCGHPRVWGSTGNTVWSIPLCCCGETLSITLADLKDRFDLHGMSPEIGLDGVAAYSLERVRWPWTRWHLEAQWGYRDPWSGDPAPASRQATSWDGELRPASGPALEVPLLSGRHTLADRDGAPVEGVLFTWTHENLWEPSSVYPGGRERGAGDRLDGREERVGAYHYFAGGISWQSATTDDWDGVDCGFYGSLDDAGSTRVRVSIPQQGWERELALSEMPGRHEVVRVDALGHTIEAGLVHSLASDVADVAMAFGHFRHSCVEGERPPDPPAGFLAPWDGWLQVVQGDGYVHVAEARDLERGGSYLQGTDDRFLTRYDRTRLLAWQASTLEPEGGEGEIDRVHVQVSIPNPRVYAGSVSTLLRGQAGTVVIDFPALLPPVGWCKAVDGGTGYDHEVRARVESCACPCR